MTFYKGFSTIQGNKWQLSDIELVKRDILNHFNTRRGERLMNPNFGSRIWELTFEQFSPELRDAILADVESIIDFDPRVNSRGVELTEYEHGFQISMDLYFIQQDYSDSMYVQFNSDANQMTSI